MKICSVVRSRIDRADASIQDLVLACAKPAHRRAHGDRRLHADLLQLTAVGVQHLEPGEPRERDELLGDGSFGHRWSRDARAVLNGLVHAPETRARIEQAFHVAKDANEEHVLSDSLAILETMPPPRSE